MCCVLSSVETKEGELVDEYKVRSPRDINAEKRG
jgi:hypothetical protein